MQLHSETNNGAINAIRGYRRQFLYSLYRLLKDKEFNYIFEPEGFFEDLDIKDHTGKYIETIQVKNTSGTLVFSDLFSKKDSFFKRAKKAINSDAKIVKIVCFGELSEELKDKSLSKIKKKLIKKGFKERQITNLVNVYDYEIVSEDELQTWILNYLKGLGDFIDPEIALDILLFWLYKVAEKRLSITAREFIFQLNKIGKYISERVDFHKKFGSSIKPLEIKNFSEENINYYKEGFYFGVSAKYEHILANVDIERSKRLQEVDEAFKKSNVVFIHGASGQGKSSLAYRYLKDSQSQFASYELKLTNNYNEVLETINSLEVLCKGLNFPVILYIDVASQYMYWEEVIKELYDKTNIHFLVTIRQEDWNMLSFEHHFSFTDIELSFEKDEAQQLYFHFSTYKTDLKFISFEESWKQVGESSPLLEYVYFLTQGVTLKSRLREQIRRIQEKVETNKTKDIEILRFVSLSDSFNSRINYKSLVQHLDVNNPTLYIDYFKKEYLLQLSDDKVYLTGLHPVRSQIISELLFDDDILIDKNDYISKTLQLIHEEDLHIFLLSAFNYKYDVNQCITALLTIKLNTWSGYNNVIKALIWKGIYDYVFTDNEIVFKEFYSTYSGAWSLFLDIDFSNTRKEDALIDIIRILNKEKEVQEKAIKIYKDLNRKLTKIGDVYNYSKRWLNTDLTFPSRGINDKDWNAFGEFLFRLSLIHLEKSAININSSELINYFNETTSIESMANVILGLKESKIDCSLNIDILECTFINKFRKKYNIVKFEITEERINSRYFFDLIDFESEESVKNPFHDKTLEIQNLVRRAFPEREEYEIKGYGYNFLKIDMPDDTSKCMPRQNLPLSLLTEQNALVINLFNNSLRQNTWQEYVDLLFENRGKLFDAFVSLKKGLVLYFKDNVKGVNYLVDNEIEIKEMVNSFSYLLPLCAIDKWGYKGEKAEVRLDNESSHNTEQNLSHQKFEELLETRREYFTSSQNFINQSFKAINDTICRINDPDYKIDDDNFNNVTEVNLFNAAYNLFLFQTQFERCFEKFTIHQELNSLSKNEVNTIIELMTIWKEFLYSHYRISKSTSRKANLTFELTKNQLLQKIYSEIIKIGKQTGQILNLNTDTDEKRLIIQVETSSDDYLESVGICVDVAINVFSSMHHSSVKSLLTKLNFEVISIIPLFQSHPINNKYLELPLFRIDKVKEILYSNNENINIFEIFQFPSDINKKILNKEGLIPWNERIPEIAIYEKIMGVASGMKLICQQYNELQDKFNSTDNLGQELISEYKIEIINHFIQIVKQGQPEIDKLYSISVLDSKFHQVIKGSIKVIIDYLDELSSNALIDFDMELISRNSDILEDNYLVFSERMVLSYLGIDS